MRPLPYEIASRITSINPYLRARDAYRDWLVQEYAPHLGIFCRFSPHELPQKYWDTEQMRKLFLKGIKVSDRLSVHCFGRNFRKRKTGLWTIFATENRGQGGKLVRPHIHLGIEYHPLLTRDIILDEWQRVDGKKALKKAQYVERVTDPALCRRKIEYMLRHVTWANEPYNYKPLTRELMLNKKSLNPSMITFATVSD